MAQLRADFAIDKNGGCSPLNISFTNTSTGAAANAEYQWDFGNGNTSFLQNPGAVFNEEKQYTVTLTIKDGSQTSVKTKTITVYKKPTIDFTFSPNNGCLPMPVTFNSVSSAGNGSITSYQWDFGDGTTQQSFSGAASHSYTFEQTASVSLTAINDYGCANTLTKANIISVKKELLVDFTADKTIACFAPATITFSNSSTGPGTLSYYWEFGDGGTSTQANPSYTYTQKGTYTVKLTTTSSEGCTKQKTITSYINVEDFITDFQVPSLMCSEEYVTFNNLSSPVPGQCSWLIDGTTSFFTYGNNSIGYSFTEGIHTIQLTSNFGPCQRTTTKQIEIKKRPRLNGFVADVAGLCGAPVQINFSDTTSGAVSWQWNFNWWYNNLTVNSTVKNPSYTYNSDGSYYVNLKVVNADGCDASITQTVGISKPLVGIFLDDGSSADGCGPHTVKFVSRTTDSIISYSWNFGDGSNLSALPDPIHTYQQAGSYAVSLTYTTVNGCTGTVYYYNGIRVYTKPVASFSSLSGTTICGNSVVRFESSSTGSVSDQYWYINDQYSGSSYYNQFNHQFYDTGYHTIRLIAVNNGCRDTMTKVDYIHILPPFPKISAAINTCAGNRDLVTFTDGSRLADSWNWDFGDGTSASYTIPQTTITHTYPRTDQYKVVLTTTKGACSVRDSTIVYVLVKQHPLLTASQTQICEENGLNYTLSNLETTPYTGAWVSYFFNQWQYGDNSPFLGTNTNDFNFVHPLPYNGSLQYFDRNKDKIRVIVIETYFSCLDTSNYIPLSFIGAKAGFEVVTNNVCFKSPVVFRDTSKTSVSNPILSWQWNFGDGFIQTFTQGGTVSHVYANPGYYYVSLKITDAGGCISNSSVSHYVEVTGPKAIFYTSGTTVQLNTTVSFYNYSNYYNSPNTTWSWNFGNGATSTDFSPSYTFTDPGDYMVTLIAENLQTGCKDTARQLITVRNFNTGFNTSVSFIGNNNQCPPVLANFYNTSTNYTKLVWDFGDGVILENQYAPSHIYNVAGTYFVILKVYGYNGLTGTYRDTIVVGQPTATINAGDIEGCIGHKVLLNAPVHTDAVSYLWDFGNGYMVNATDSFATHQFLDAGSFSASLIVKDANGCRSLATLPDKIIIHPNPVVAIQPAAPFTCKENPVALNASGGSIYLWSPASGLNDNNIASPLALPLTTTIYQVKVTDSNGCIDSSSVTVDVPQLFNLNAKKDYDICIGKTVQLNASGADTYKWINTTTGLSSTAISNPVASPFATALYTIVGYDQYQCYSDTVDVIVNVRSLPTVNAGPDRTVLFGSENILNLSTSNDVVKWLWTPPDFLSCTDCPAPVSKLYSPTEYVITVYNSYDCQSKDTISIKAFCSSDGIYIPNAFTPNNDGKNDVFGINGSGVGLIKSFRIYNRWGTIVFEKKNFFSNDISSSWDGRYKGVDAPVGAYVYFAEMECNAGERFERKGTVTLVR